MQNVYMSKTQDGNPGLFTNGVMALPLRSSDIDNLTERSFTDAKSFVKEKWRFELVRHPQSREGCSCDPCQDWFGGPCDAHEG